MEYWAAAIRRVPNSFSIKGSKLQGQLTSFICITPIKAETVLIKETVEYGAFPHQWMAFLCRKTFKMRSLVAPSQDGCGLKSRWAYANVNWTKVLVLQIITRLVQKNNWHWVKWRERSTTRLQWWAFTTKQQTLGYLRLHACALSPGDEMKIGERQRVGNLPS